jgi:carbon dioxide concentrating mechanism protein CcmN
MVQAHEQLAIGDYYIGANVELAPDVAIAAGVVLEAAPGARLVIASGVCLGLGVIVQAAGASWYSVPASTWAVGS